MSIVKLWREESLQVCIFSFQVTKLEQVYNFLSTNLNIGYVMLALSFTEMLESLFIAFLISLFMINSYRNQTR